MKYAETISLACARAGVLADCVAPGVVVAADADVARLHDGVLLAQRAIAAKQAENDVEVRFAQKSADVRRLKHERAIVANQSQAGAVTELELCELHLDAQRAELQREQAEHTLAVTRLRLAELDAQLASLRLRAPSEVFVRAVHKRKGEFVQQGEVVAEVVNIRRLRVEGYADLKTAGYLYSGAPIRVQVGDGASAVVAAGKVDFVDVKIEPVSQRLRFSAAVQSRAGLLREGMVATVFAQPRAVAAKPQRLATTTENY